MVLERGIDLKIQYFSLKKHLKNEKKKKKKCTCAINNEHPRCDSGLHGKFGILDQISHVPDRIFNGDFSRRCLRKTGINDWPTQLIEADLPLKLIKRKEKENS